MNESQENVSNLSDGLSEQARESFSPLIQSHTQYWDVPPNLPKPFHWQPIVFAALILLGMGGLLYGRALQAERNRSLAHKEEVISVTRVEAIEIPKPTTDLTVQSTLYNSPTPKPSLLPTKPTVITVPSHTPTPTIPQATATPAQNTPTPTPTRVQATPTPLSGTIPAGTAGPDFTFDRTNPITYNYQKSSYDGFMVDKMFFSVDMTATDIQAANTTLAGNMIRALNDINISTQTYPGEFVVAKNPILKCLNNYHCSFDVTFTPDKAKDQAKRTAVIQLITPEHAHDKTYTITIQNIPAW